MKKNMLHLSAFLMIMCIASELEAMGRISPVVVMCSSVGHSISNAAKSAGSRVYRYVSYVSKNVISLPGYFINRGQTYVPAPPPLPPFPKNDYQKLPEAAGKVGADKSTMMSRIGGTISSAGSRCTSAISTAGSKCASALSSAKKIVKEAVAKHKKTIIRSAIALGGLVAILLSYKYWKSALPIQPVAPQAPVVPAMPVIVNPAPINTVTPISPNNPEVPQPNPAQPAQHSSTAKTAIKRIAGVMAATATYAILGRIFGFDTTKWGGKSE